MRITLKAYAAIGCDRFLCCLEVMFRQLQSGTLIEVCVSCITTGATQTLSCLLPPSSGIAVITLPHGSQVRPIPPPPPPLQLDEMLFSHGNRRSVISPARSFSLLLLSPILFLRRRSHTVVTVPPTAASVVTAIATGAAMHAVGAAAAVGGGSG